MPFIVAKVNPKEWGGRSTLVFSDQGQHGSGIPRWTSFPGYMPSTIPTAVGARYFPPEPDYGEDDQPIPLAYGSKWEGGRPVYQERVYQAAKAKGSSVGLSQTQIDGLKPRKVA